MARRWRSGGEAFPGLRPQWILTFLASVVAGRSLAPSQNLLVHTLIQGSAGVDHLSSLPRRVALKLLLFWNSRVRTEPWNQPRTSHPSLSRTAITAHASSLISQSCCARGSLYTPAKPPAGLGEDALDTTSASTVADVVAAGAPKPSRDHQPKAMPPKRLTAIGQPYTAAHARRHGHTKPARNIGMLPAGIMAAAHSLGSKLTVQQAKALQAASQCLATGWACGHRPQCWAYGRHPCGIACNKVDGPVAEVSNGGGTRTA